VRRVLITCPPMLLLIDEFRSRFYECGIELLTPKIIQTLDEGELIGMLPACDGWIAGDDPANRRVLASGAAGKLRVLIKWGVGVDNVDQAACKALNLKFAHTPGVFGKEVADLAVNYIGGLARETMRIDREIRIYNGWPKPSGISLAGKVVALVGLGDIGRQAARRLFAADMKIIGYDPLVENMHDIGVEWAQWPDRLEEADFLLFTCPLTDMTRGIFNSALLPRLKRGVRVVNVARGGVVVTEALIEGLRSGAVHSAALDVYENEPLSPDSPLREFERCIFGSHNASNTEDAVRRVSHRAIDLLVGFLDSQS